MSGIKERVVPVTDRMLESMLSDIRQSQRSAQRSQQELERARQELQNQARRDRQALERQLSNQQAQMHEMEREYAQKMQSQAQAFNKQLERQAEVTNDRFDQVDQRFKQVDRRLQDIETSVTNLRAETHQLVEDARSYTDQRFDQLAAQIHNKEELQRRQAETAQTVFQTAIQRVKGLPRFKKFADIDLLNELENDAHIASEQMKMLGYGAAYGAYRSATYKVHQLEQEIITRQHEWLSTRQVVRAEVETGLADSLAAAEHEQEWELEEGGAELIKTRVDHWTGGALTELKTQLDGIKGQLSDERSEALSLDELKALATDASERRSQVAQALRIAQEQCALSQQRFEFVDAVVESLAPLYTPKKDGYLEGDQRNGYSLLMSGPTGDQVVIRVDPSVHQTNPEQLANTFSVDYFTPTGQRKDVPPNTQRTIQNAFSEVLGEAVQLVCQDHKYPQGRPERLTSASILKSPESTSLQAQQQSRVKQRVMKTATQKNTAQTTSTLG